jgi:uncharacterized protein (DUF1800 family)
MEFPKASLTTLLCMLVSVPAAAGFAQSTVRAPSKAATRPAYASAQLRGDQRVVHALNRFTFGARPGDVEAVRTMGLDNWFESQLHPESLDQSSLNARLAQFPAMQWSVRDLLYRLPGNATIRQAMDGRAPVPSGGILHSIYENHIYRMQLKKTEDNRKLATAQATMNPPTAETGAMGPTQSPMMQPAAAMTNGVEMAVGTPRSSVEATSTIDRAAQQTPPAPALSDAELQSILALAPQQRVARLAAMQPAEFEGFIHSLRPQQRIALEADLTPEQRETVGALENPERLVGEELIAQRLTRDIYSSAQLQEVMTDFWFNHFNVYLRKSEQMPYYLVGYERDTIRPRALGKFEDLLEAVAHSPAMMLYLDNATSMGPDSPAAQRAQMAAFRKPATKQKAPEGLNENYARELMELHTLGVNGGYTQADVVQVARVLTGWTVDRPQFGGDFIFTPNRHEPGAKTVLGQTIKDGGEAEGRELLHMLAMHPATAHFLARKLAVRFVSDDPPQALVERLAKSYLASGGDIAAVLRTLFHSPEFWSAGAYRAKVKTPLEFVVSAARASNAQIDNLRPLANALRQMGMPLYGSMPPTGYKWEAADWVSTAALVDRMNFSMALAANRLPGISTVWNGPAPDTTQTSSPASEEARLEPLLIAGGASVATRSAALQQLQTQSAQEAARPLNAARSANALERQDRMLAGLLLGSPEFQRR